MTAANVNVRPDISSGIAAHDATNLVLLFALNRIPVSKQRLVCRWHHNSDGRLSCRWEPIPRSRILDPKEPVERFVSRDGSNIVPA
jgi:hypothetical protein